MKAQLSVSKSKNPPAAANEQNLFEQLDGALRRLMWAERRWLKQALAAHELDVAPYMLLMQLLKHDDVCPMKELAQALNFPNATTTGYVDRLEQQGLVRREFGNQQDRRQVRVHVTAQGRAFAQRIKEQRRQYYRHALQHLAARDQTQFVKLLSVFLDKVESVK